MKEKVPPKCPLVDPKLVSYLNFAFPNTLTKITPNMSEREVGMMIGRAQVVDYLRRTAEDQTKNNLLDQ